jgi:hypothetical protein
MNFIIDPVYGTRYELFSTNGKNLLKQYVKYMQSGGLLLTGDKEEIVEDINGFIEVKDKDGKIIVKKDMIHIMDLLHHLHNKYTIQRESNYKEWMRYAVNLIMYKFKDSGIVDKILIGKETKDYKSFKNACSKKGKCSEQIEKIINVDIDKTIYKKNTVQLLLYVKDNKSIKNKQLKEYFLEKYKKYKNELNNKIETEEANKEASKQAKEAIEEKKKKVLSTISEGSEREIESSSYPFSSLPTTTRTSK